MCFLEMGGWFCLVNLCFVVGRILVNCGLWFGFGVE